MFNLPYYRRKYKILEKQCIELFSIVVIDDQCLDLPNATYSDLIHAIVPTIEGLAKDLHKELAQTDLAKSKKLQEYKEKEHFDYQALAFLDKALGLSQKQVKLTSELVALSEEKGNRILTPLQNAHKSEQELLAEQKDATDESDQTYQRPLWIRAYQDYKHDQANAQQNSANCPTAKALLEAIGAAFLLLAVARSLPLNDENKFAKFDFTFGSELFEASYTRPFFKDFVPLSKDFLHFDPNWDKALFVVKDPERYIRFLRASQYANDEQFVKAFSGNPKFFAFFNNLPEEHKKKGMRLNVQRYGQETADPQQKAWSQELINLTLSTSANYILYWSYGRHDQLSRFGFDPLVALNYNDADHLYDYDKLSLQSSFLENDLKDPQMRDARQALIMPINAHIVLSENTELEPLTDAK